MMNFETNDVRSLPSYRVIFKTTIFPIIGKKKYQLSVSDADREIQTLVSTENHDGNSVNLVSGIIRLPSG